MTLKKIIDEKNKTSVHAWYFDNEAEKGIALGQYNREKGVAEHLVSVGQDKGGQKQIIINRDRLKELGYSIVIE